MPRGAVGTFGCITWIHYCMRIGNYPWNRYRMQLYCVNILRNRKMFSNVNVYGEFFSLLLPVWEFLGEEKYRMMRITVKKTREKNNKYRVHDDRSLFMERKYFMLLFIGFWRPGSVQEITRSSVHRIHNSLKPFTVIYQHGNIITSMAGSSRNTITSNT